MNSNNQIIALYWASGSGKSEIIKYILETYSQVEKLLNCTTRQKRNWVDNDYVFLSKEEFLKKRRKNEIIESTKIETDGIKQYYWIVKPEWIWTKVVSLDGKWIKIVSKYCEKNNIDFISIWLNVDENERIYRMIERWDSIESVNKRVAFDRSHFTSNPGEICNYKIDANQKISKVLEEINWILTWIL